MNGNKKEPKYAWPHLLALALIVPIEAVVWGWCVSYCWGVFAVGLGAPSITLVQGIGLRILAACLTQTSVKDGSFESELKGWEAVVETALVGLISPLVLTALTFGVALFL